MAACSFATAYSQVVLSEDFTAPFNPTASNWIVQNNSVPSGTVSWTQGNQTGGNNGLVAFNGNTDDFYMADFMATTYPGAGGISAFLITPPVTIYNGAVLQFATRTASFSAPNIYPDRMQVLMSPVSAVAIPTGSTSVGTFTNLILDINPNLSTSNSTVVVGNTVNGYPMAWTVYSLPISGVTGTVTGRFAFRYFVANGGSNGANSRLIGLDAVRYTLPCGATAPSYTSCASTPVTINATGGLAATSYSWSTGATGSALNVSPASTTVYTLTSIVNGLACSPVQTTTVTIGTNLNVNVSASSQTVCSGRSVTLTASSAGTSYAWGTVGGTAPLGTAATLVVTPSVTTTYTIGAATLPCFGTNQIQITVNASPQPSVNISPACVGSTFTITASGANSYTYLASSQNPQTVTSPTATGGYFFTLVAGNANGCTVSGVVNFSVNPAASIAIAASKTVECINRTVTLTANPTASGTYSWSGAASSTANPITYSTSTSGNKTFNVLFTDANGCTATAARTVSFATCTGIETINGSNEANVYPNPFSNEIRVTGLSGRVELYNALGQLVLATNITEAETINTSDIAKGAYILKVYNSSNNVDKTIKLLKN